MEIEGKDVWYLIGDMLIVSIFVSVIIGGFLFEPKIDNPIHLKDISQVNKKGMLWGGDICTQSVNTYDFLCNEKKYICNLYNITQEKFDELKTECPTGEIIKSTHCIGGYLDPNDYNILNMTVKSII